MLFQLSSALTQQIPLAIHHKGAGVRTAGRFEK